VQPQHPIIRSGPSAYTNAKVNLVCVRRYNPWDFDLVRYTPFLVNTPRLAGASKAASRDYAFFAINPRSRDLLINFFLLFMVPVSPSVCKASAVTIVALISVSSTLVSDLCIYFEACWGQLDPSLSRGKECGLY